MGNHSSSSSGSSSSPGLTAPAAPSAQHKQQPSSNNHTQQLTNTQLNQSKHLPLIPYRPVAPQFPSFSALVTQPFPSSNSPKATGTTPAQQFIQSLTALPSYYSASLYYHSFLPRFYLSALHAHVLSGAYRDDVSLGAESSMRLLRSFNTHSLVPIAAGTLAGIISLPVCKYIFLSLHLLSRISYSSPLSSFTGCASWAVSCYVSNLVFQRTAYTVAHVKALQPKLQVGDFNIGVLGDSDSTGWRFVEEHLNTPPAAAPNNKSDSTSNALFSFFTSKSKNETSKITAPSLSPTLLLLFSLIPYRLLRGRFSHFAPSSITRKGAFTREVIATGDTSTDYASSAARAMLQSAGARYGCHHCGRSASWCGVGPSLKFIGDHMPPNKYVKLEIARYEKYINSGIIMKLLFRPWRHLLVSHQEFLPQCERCSSVQSIAVRVDSTRLILPRSFRAYDVFNPLPYLLLLLITPIIQQLWGNVEKQAEQNIEQERKNRERAAKSSWW